MKKKNTILINGKIITEDAVLSDHYLVLHDSIIVGVFSNRDSLILEDYDEVIDCGGMFILPGLIDIHSDMIENIIVPRKGLIFPIAEALHEADKQLICQGITTIFHSISIANSTICNRKRTLSVSEMISIGDEINQLDTSLMIHHRFHARLEMNTIEAYKDIFIRARQNMIHELSLMNHTPGQGQYASLEVFKTEIRKQYGEVTEERTKQIIEECQAKPVLSKHQIKELLICANSNGIPVAFHDVETEEQLNFMQKYHIRISEFPLSDSIAEKATKRGFYNVVGAPNIVRNGSHNNNAKASNLLSQGNACIICSDYYSPALLAAVFMLPKITQLTLPEAVRFATIVPAKAVYIDKEYGSITPGKRADIIVVDNNGRIPKVAMSFVDGIKKLQLHHGGDM